MIRLNANKINLQSDNVRFVILFLIAKTSDSKALSLYFCFILSNNLNVMLVIYMMILHNIALLYDSEGLLKWQYNF
jgi:hypothetical protein